MSQVQDQSASVASSAPVPFSAPNGWIEHDGWYYESQPEVDNLVMDWIMGYYIDVINPEGPYVLRTELCVNLEKGTPDTRNARCKLEAGMQVPGSLEKVVQVKGENGEAEYQVMLLGSDGKSNRYIFGNKKAVMESSEEGEAPKNLLILRQDESEVADEDESNTSDEEAEEEEEEKEEDENRGLRTFPINCAWHDHWIVDSEEPDWSNLPHPDTWVESKGWLYTSEEQANMQMDWIIRYDFDVFTPLGPYIVRTEQCINSEGLIVIRGGRRRLQAGERVPGVSEDTFAVPGKDNEFKIRIKQAEGTFYYRIGQNKAELIGPPGQPIHDMIASMDGEGAIPCTSHDENIEHDLDWIDKQNPCIVM